MEYKRVMTIAGSDSGGGAGIQADIKTISACGCYATSAITAITVQNTLGVQGIHPVPTAILSEQIKAILEDIGTDAIKIGMLHNKQVIEAVAEILQEFALKNVVLDPVMVATSGDKLLEDEAIESLQKTLIPLVRVITPNIPEAEILLGRGIALQEEFPQIAQELAEKYNTSVLLKAGHLHADDLTDVLYDTENGTTTLLKSQRVETQNTHGTGCTLSSALASYLALGRPLSVAASFAKDYLIGAITKGQDYHIGAGHGPVHHFHRFWK